MTQLYVYNSNGKKETVELVSTFTMSTNNFKYIIYKSNGNYYAGKVIGEGLVNFSSPIDDLEFQLFKAILRDYYDGDEISINPDHKKIDLVSISDKKAKIFKILSSGVLLTISAFLLKTKIPDFQADYKYLTNYSIEQQVDYEIPNDDSVISYYFKDENNQWFFKSSITEEDYPLVKYVSVNLRENTDLSFLKNFDNLEKVKIIVNNKEEALKSIKKDTFTKPIELALVPTDSHVESCSFITEDDYGFLREIDHITTLSLGERYKTYVVDNNYLSSLQNVDELDIDLDCFSNFDAKKYDYLDTLKIYGEPYNIPISVSKKDIEYLRKHVNLIIEDEDKVNEVNNRIEEIAKKLNIKNDSSDVEKLNAILKYVLFKYKYPENVESTKKYYEGGFLFSSLNGDDQICGNYAAMLSALAKYFDLKMDIVVSNTHAWNVVKVNNHYFYVDSTFIDDMLVDDVDMDYQAYTSDGGVVNVVGKFSVPAEYIFSSNNTEKMDDIEWYLKDIDKTYDDTHKQKNLPPNYYSEKEYDIKEKVIDITNQQFDVIIDNEKLSMDASMLLSILLIFGDAVYLGVSGLRKGKIKRK